MQTKRRTNRVNRENKGDVMKRKNVEAVIFDLDGVLVSTDQFHYLAWKRLSDQLGIQFDEQINYRCRGVSRTESLRIILEDSGKDFTDRERRRFLEMKNRWYREFLEKMTPKDVSREVTETLLWLRGEGYRLAVGSSSRNAGLILERTGLVGRFDAVADGNAIRKGKPDPEVFLKAAEFLKTEPSRCLVVEDAEAGIQAAHNACMKAVLFWNENGKGWKTSSIEDSVRGRTEEMPGKQEVWKNTLSRADYILHQISDIRKVLRKEETA